MNMVEGGLECMVFVSVFLLMFGEVEGFIGSGGGRLEVVLVLVIDDVWGVLKGGILVLLLLYFCYVGYVRVLVLRSYLWGGLLYLLCKMLFIILDVIFESIFVGIVVIVILYC